MLKRIKQLKGVGTFFDAGRVSRHQFEHLTFIFGLNSYGKSTLCDIFHSLKNNDPDIVKNRETICDDYNCTQNIQLSFEGTTDAPDEKTIFFQNSIWNYGGITKKIEIFDTRFVNNNVFTGFQVTRDNKENFTDFILGEENVKIARELQVFKKNRSSLKKELNAKKDSLKKFFPKEVFSETTTDDIIAWQIDDDIEDIIVSLKRLKRIKLKREENIKNKQKILSKHLPSEVDFETDILDWLEKTNNILTTDFEDINEKAAERVQEHIKHSFKTHDNEEESWLKQGFLEYVDVEQLEDSNCPFCGQSLSDASELMKVFQSYFNDEYKSYVESLERDLNKFSQNIKKEDFDSLNTLIKNNTIKIKAFLEFIDDPDFLTYLESFESAAKSIEKTIKKIKTEKTTIANKLTKKIKRKKQSPHLSTQEIDFSTIEDLIDKLTKNISDIEQAQDNLIEFIKNLKTSHDTSDAEEKLQAIDKKILKLELKKRRKENDTLCTEIQEKQEEVENINCKIDDKDEELKTTQDQYLKKYFSAINRYFKKLGSGEYEIQKSLSPHGHKPVILIKVKFRGIKIPESKFSYVFSDSDRRALALSIFLAKIATMLKEEKEKTIIVLDDPVTSFDENRITHAINEISKASSRFKQFIILTHYPFFIKRFLEIHETNTPPKLLKIERKSNSCTLDAVEKDFFCLTDHAACYKKINGFINREHHNDINKDLRLFFDHELENRFRKQISEKSIDYSNTRELIQGLYNEGAIDEDDYEKLNEFRRTFNPEHHIFTSGNPEDIIAVAQDLMTFLYYDLHAAP